MKLTEGKRKEVKAELDKLARTRKGLTPETVVESARSKSSPLHKYFTWEDTEAARRWREYQAAALIRSVSVVIERPLCRPVEVRAYVNTREIDKDGCINLGNKGKYQSVTAVLQEPTKREQMLEQAKRELKAFRIKYAILDELAKVWEAVDQVAS